MTNLLMYLYRTGNVAVAIRSAVLGTILAATILLTVPGLREDFKDFLEDWQKKFKKGADK